MKMQRTIIILWDYLHYVYKYAWCEKCCRNMPMYLFPCFRDTQIGDIVTVEEDQPLSKMVCFNLLKATSTKKKFQKFSDWMSAHFLKCNKLYLMCYALSTLLNALKTLGKDLLREKKKKKKKKPATSYIIAIIQ
uniref:40S ribosomal protein S11 n=1 Tax=Sciurus vulgaris TaxID=55149 RepID=A0A8D2D7R5_SCIVU